MRICERVRTLTLILIGELPFSGPFNELTVLMGIGDGLYSVPSQRTAELTVYI
jgi:hypothetical protein